MTPEQEVGRGAADPPAMEQFEHALIEFCAGVLLDQIAAQAAKAEVPQDE